HRLVGGGGRGRGPRPTIGGRRTRGHPRPHRVTSLPGRVVRRGSRGDRVVLRALVPTGAVGGRGPRRSLRRRRDGTEYHRVGEDTAGEGRRTRRPVDD